MKGYDNGMKATEFSKKQISVIYGMAKRKEINLEKWVASDLYDMADYYDYDHNGSAERAERSILNIINAAFAGDMAELQKRIDNYTKSTFELFSAKQQKELNREFV